MAWQALASYINGCWMAWALFSGLNFEIAGNYGFE